MPISNTIDIIIVIFSISCAVVRHLVIKCEHYSPMMMSILALAGWQLSWLLDYADNLATLCRCHAGIHWV